MFKDELIELLNKIPGNPEIELVVQEPYDTDPQIVSGPLNKVIYDPQKEIIALLED